jgi:Zn-dependent protease
MQNWWVQDAWDISPVLLISWVVWVIGSIVLHELSHGWAAIACGDRTPVETGHMTLNPVVHMGPASLIAFALLGIAWGLMPINPSRFRHRYADAIVAFAGPLMNILLAALALVGMVLWTGFGGGHWTTWHAEEPLFGNVRMFLLCGIGLNLSLAAFNLLPVPPLDGSRILSDFVPAYRRMLDGPNAGVIAIIMMVALFAVGGDIVYRFGFGTAGRLIAWALDIAIPNRP